MSTANLSRRLLTATPVAALALIAAVVCAAPALGAACDEADTVGGGALGVSPGPVGPPSSLGWDVGGGQCNGSFTTTVDAAFPGNGGGIELGLRIEERRIGQVTRIGANEYLVSSWAPT